MLKTDKIEIPKYSVPAIAVSASLSLALLGGVHILTRPCTIAKCKEISQAEQLAENSEKILLPSPSENKILAANRQLVSSIEILESIPSWSTHRSEAENLLKAYQYRAESLHNQAKALEGGAKAASISQNPPILLSKLEESKTLWQEAIASWEQVLADREFSSFIQKKIQEYQKNLAFIEQQIETERQAIEHLKAAKEAAKEAIASLNNAQSFSSWEQVYTHWGTAIERLKGISKNTTAYDEARLLLEICRVRLILAQERKDIEEAALKAYELAIDIAQQAKKFESSQEWSKAVSGWRSALTHLKQIPQNSFQYRQVQPLMVPYTQALNRAQVKLHSILRIKQARSDLEKTCSGEIRVCNYTVSNDGIKVYLTPPYKKRVWETALQTQTEGNPIERAQLLDHVNSLEQALKTITKNAGILVEVYNPERVLVLTFAPKE